jgi:hypothetical protein
MIQSGSGSSLYSRSNTGYGVTWGSPGRDEDCPIRGGEMTAASYKYKVFLYIFLAGN